MILMSDGSLRMGIEGVLGEVDLLRELVDEGDRGGKGGGTLRAELTCALTGTWGASNETLAGGNGGGGGLFKTGVDACFAAVGRGGSGGNRMLAVTTCSTGTLTNPLQRTESLSGFLPVTAATGICLTWRT
jgi:hypothetical protein